MAICLITIVFSVLSTVVPVLAASPSAPRLVINTKSHSALIIRADVTNDCSLAITGSDDNTARVWRLAPNRGGAQLVKVLRPAPGAGGTGRVTAVALTDDGELAALAASRANGTSHVMIYSMRDRRVVKQIELGNRASSFLRFNNSGNYLAAALDKPGGVLVWSKATSWRPVLDDRSYARKASSVIFDASNFLYVSSYDQFIRKYRVIVTNQTNFHLVTAEKAAAADRPYMIALNAAETKLAVGFDRQMVVQVLDADSLRSFGKPKKVKPRTDRPDSANDDISAIAWTPSGEGLIAGGFWDENDWHQLTYWPDARKSQHRSWSAAVDSITYLERCSHGIFVAAADPAFGVISPRAPSSRPLIWQQSQKIDPRAFRDIFERTLMVSQDASRVRFQLSDGQSKKDWRLFDLSKLQLSLSPDPSADLRPVDTTSLRLRDWFNKADTDTERHPNLNGNDLDLPKDLFIRSVSISPNQDRFYVGTEKGIFAYRSDGRRFWKDQLKTSQIVWQINASRDNRIIVSTEGDGTIRWRRADNGRDLLALFVERPTAGSPSRWVAWTPSGYFAASVGGEQLIAWSIERKASPLVEIHPVSKFRREYYRPDIVKLVLSTLDEAVAIVQGNKKSGRVAARGVEQLQPPTIEILLPTNEITTARTQLSIPFKVSSSSGEKPSRIVAYRDGVPIGKILDQSGLVTIEGEPHTFKGSMTIELEPHDASIALIPETGNKIGAAATLSVRWTGSTGTRAAPELHALVVGISNYTQARLRLRYAASDATTFANLLKRQTGGIYSKIHVKSLIDEQATERAIRKTLATIGQNKKDNDTLLLYFSGHGATTQSGGSYLLTHGFDPGNPLLWYDKDTLFRLLAKIPGKKIVILDACHAGGGLSALQLQRIKLLDVKDTINDVTANMTGTIVFASSLPGGLSFESDRLQQSIFSSVLFDGLEGKADMRDDDKIYPSELKHWLELEVKKASSNRQHASMDWTRGLATDLPIFGISK